MHEPRSSHAMPPPQSASLRQSNVQAASAQCWPAGQSGSPLHDAAGGGCAPTKHTLTVWLPSAA